MNGTQEVPVNASAAFGSATVTYTASGDSLTYSVSFGDLLGFASVAHIHFGDPGLTGPVILPLRESRPAERELRHILGDPHLDGLDSESRVRDPHLRGCDRGHP